MSFLGHAQKEQSSDEVYFYKPKVDIPVTAVAALGTLYNFTQIYSKDASSEAAIMALDPSNVNSFDRGAAGNFDEDAKALSDIFFYAAFPAPLVAFAADKHMRQDYFKLSLIYLETISLTGIVYSTSQQINDRRRPFTYNTDLDIVKRTRGSGRNSFIGGHPAVVATSSFMIAKMYSDYHPDNGFKYALYGLAAASSFATAYLRVEAGQHFPSDVIVGSVVGAGIGWLIPHLHKNKNYSKRKLGVLPFTGDFHGLQLSYKF